MHGRSLGVLLPAVLLLAGCAGCSAAGSAESTSLIYGLVTDSDRQGLVASYIGGACDGPARLAVTENASRIEVTVNIGTDPHGSEACPAVGYSRTVAARLAQPIGTRAIFSGDYRQVPFDGSRKLLPSVLPLNFAKTSEESGSEPALDPAQSSIPAATPSSGLNAENATTRWAVTYAQPQPAIDRCVPTRGVIEIQVGPASADDFASGWSAAGTVNIAGHPARLWRAGNASAPTGWAYAWKADRGTVEVMAQAGCQGDRLLDAAELLKVAQSLKSA